MPVFFFDILNPPFRFGAVTALVDGVGRVAVAATGALDVAVRALSVDDFTLLLLVASMCGSLVSAGRACIGLGLVLRASLDPKVGSFVDEEVARLI